MDLTISELIENVLASAWRRRVLILVPILLFTGVGALAANLWPSTFSSSMLIMLQEKSGSLNPLLANAETSRDVRFRVDEIQALLKSERVLSSAVLDMRSGNPTATPREMENAVRDLKSSLFVKVVGPDFIEIELRDTTAQGLGGRLSIISTRFLESIMSWEDSIKTARRFAMEQRKRDVDQAKIALDQFLARRIEMNAQSAKALASVDVARAELDDARIKLKQAAHSLFGESIEIGRIAEAVAKEQATHAKAPANGDTNSISRQRTAALNDLTQRQQWYDDLVIKLASAEGLAKSSEGSNAAADEVKQQQERLETRLARVTAEFEAHSKRASIARGSAGSPLGLIAPEYIRIVDEPRDPIAPMTSVLKIIIACIGAGIGIGVGLAVLAEQLDDRVYTTTGLDQITGAPLIVRLPKVGWPLPSAKHDVGGPEPGINAQTGLIPFNGIVAGSDPQSSSLASRQLRQIGKV